MWPSTRPISTDGPRGSLEPLKVKETPDPNMGSGLFLAAARRDGKALDRPKTCSSFERRQFQAARVRSRSYLATLNTWTLNTWLKRGCQAARSLFHNHLIA